MMNRLFFILYISNKNYIDIKKYYFFSVIIDISQKNTHNINKKTELSWLKIIYC